MVVLVSTKQSLYLVLLVVHHALVGLVCHSKDVWGVVILARILVYQRVLVLKNKIQIMIYTYIYLDF